MFLCPATTSGQLALCETQRTSIMELLICSNIGWSEMRDNKKKRNSL